MKPIRIEPEFLPDKALPYVRHKHVKPRVLYVNVFSTDKDIQRPSQISLRSIEVDEEEGQTVEVHPAQLEQAGLILFADQPVLSGSNTTLWKGEECHHSGISRLARQGGEAADDAVSWTYEFRIPEAILHEMVISREWMKT